MNAFVAFLSPLALLLPAVTGDQPVLRDDPSVHEAVATEESDEHEPETISAELLRGYRIGDHVIRHSMVRVVTGPTAAVSADKTSDDARYSSQPQSPAPDDTTEE